MNSKSTELALKPGWLAEQMRETLSRTADWPICAQPLLTLNSGLQREPVSPLKQSEEQGK